MKRLIQSLIIVVLLILALACSGQNTDTAGVEANQKLFQEKRDIIKPLITFVELGSVNCIPCQQMQPVMKAIEEKYAEQVSVVFYDVWKADQKKYAQEYGIRLIPTQVFLDKDGKEIFRHEGFFPEAEIDAFLQKQGLKPSKKS
jgi:thioredoxin 1